MNDFNLRKFLSENKLTTNSRLVKEKPLNESTYTDPNTGKSYDLQFVSSKNRFL